MGLQRVRHDWANFTSGALGSPGGSDSKESSCNVGAPASIPGWDPWEDPLEKGMATHSSILAWRIPWTEEPGGLQSMGLQRVGHDWVTNTLHAIWCPRFDCHLITLELAYCRLDEFKWSLKKIKKIIKPWSVIVCSLNCVHEGEVIFTPVLGSSSSISCWS